MASAQIAVTAAPMMIPYLLLIACISQSSNVVSGSLPLRCPVRWGPACPASPWTGSSGSVGDDGAMNATTVPRGWQLSYRRRMRRHRAQGDGLHRVIRAEGGRSDIRAEGQA